MRLTLQLCGHKKLHEIFCVMNIFESIKPTISILKNLMCKIKPICENKNKKGIVCRHIPLFCEKITKTFSPHLDSTFSLVVNPKPSWDASQ